MSAEHVWFQPKKSPWPMCKSCGIIQRRDGIHGPCHGPDRLRTMKRPLSVGQVEVSTVRKPHAD